jgi:hypothetical protein
MGVDGESEATGFGVGPDLTPEDEYCFVTAFEGITQPDCLVRKDFPALLRCGNPCPGGLGGPS